MIEAERVVVLISFAARNWSGLPEWVRDAYDAGELIFLHDSIEVKTLEGVMTASREDWLIRGVNGEKYPCKPDIFAKTYEEVE